MRHNIDSDIKKSMRSGIDSIPSNALRKNKAKSTRRKLPATPISNKTKKILIGGSVGDVTGNVIPRNVREQTKYGPVQNVQPGIAFERLKGIPDKNVYRNANVDAEKYGQAIYSNLPGIEQSSLDQTFTNKGVGATGIDEQGRSTGTYTPFSQPIQSPEIQQKPGGIEMAGVNPVDNSSPLGENQYGAVGQDSLKYQQQYYSKAADILNNLPYGTPGDRQKRNAMISSAREFSALGTGYRDQFNENRKYGIDKYNALNPSKKEQSQIGRFKTVPATEGSYDEDGNYIQGAPAYRYDTTTGEKFDPNASPYASPEDIDLALTEGRIKTEKEADSLMAKYFPELVLK